MSDHILNLKLVKEIEKHPSLYDFTLRSYSCRETTKKAWDEIGMEVGLSGAECKVKWKNIRAVFSRHMTSTQELGKFKKPYYLADAMKFAIPFIKKLVYTNNIDKIKARVEPYEETESEDEDEENPLASNENSLSDASPKRPSSPRSVSPFSTESHSTMKQKQTKKRDHEEEGNVDHSNASFFSAKKSKITENKDAIQEANKMFLLSLLPDMSQMSLSQLRKFKRKTMAVIDDILENTSNVENCSNVPVYHFVENVNTASSSTCQNIASLSQTDDTDSDIINSNEYTVMKNEIIH